MGNFQGADTEALRAYAQQMRARAQALGDIRARLQPMVADEDEWRGPDAESFRPSWAATGALFDQLTAGLTGRFADLEREADEQDRASDTDGSGNTAGATGAPAGEHDGPSWWDRLRNGFDVYNRAQSVFSTPRKAWKLLRALGGIWRALDTPELSARVVEVLKGAERVVDQVFSPHKEFSQLAGKLVTKLGGIPTEFGTRRLFSSSMSHSESSRAALSRPPGSGLWSGLRSPRWARD